MGTQPNSYGYFSYSLARVPRPPKKHSVPHGKLVAYKSYIYIIKIFNLIYIDLPSKIHQAYNFLLSLLQDLWLQVSQRKPVPPHTEFICLGIVVNTITKTISIPSDKLQEIQYMHTMDL